MGKRLFLNGNYAVSYGVKLARADVVAAYPITPQTKIVEQISEFVADGEMKAEFIKVESEHTAMTACYTASCAGARAFTATSSQGLLYMYEMMQFCSGQRRPVVMANANRAISAPWTIWLDHQDCMSTRDSGWMQIHVESAQEALDTTLHCFKVAEDPAVMSPAMICLDAFVLTHTYEPIVIPEQELVDRYLPPFVCEDFVDTNNPKTFSAGLGPDFYPEMRYKQQQAILGSKEYWEKADADYNKLIGRSWGGAVEAYKCEGAEVILVTMGSLTSTARVVVDKLREQGKKVGLLKLRLYRPFPEEAVAEVLKKAKLVGIVDRATSFGYEGPVFSDIKAALYNQNIHVPAVNYMGGLGGRDISAADVEKIFEKMLTAAETGKIEKTVEFYGLRWYE